MLKRDELDTLFDEMPTLSPEEDALLLFHTGGRFTRLKRMGILTAQRRLPLLLNICDRTEARSEMTILKCLIIVNEAFLRHLSMRSSTVII